MKTEKWPLPSGIVVPVVEARVTLLTKLSQGRRLLTTGQYRPHIVIGPESQRVAVGNGNTLTENYLGVMFVGEIDSLEPGESGTVGLALIWFPEDSYSEVLPGATFTIREGPHIVGFGTILARPQ